MEPFAQIDLWDEIQICKRDYLLAWCLPINILLYSNPLNIAAHNFSKLSIW